MPKYWVVGATWGPCGDQSDLFFRRGYWLLGWEDSEQPGQAKLRDQIRVGDRIAVKKMLGQGSSNIIIRALGVVTEIDDSDKRIYVNWLLTDLNRELPSNGSYASIHGPFNISDDWVKRVFSI